MNYNKEKVRIKKGDRRYSIAMSVAYIKITDAVGFSLNTTQLSISSVKEYIDLSDNISTRVEIDGESYLNNMLLFVCDNSKGDMNNYPTRCIVLCDDIDNDLLSRFLDGKYVSEEEYIANTVEVKSYTVVPLIGDTAFVHMVETGCDGCMTAKNGVINDDNAINFVDDFLEDDVSKLVYTTKTFEPDFGVKSDTPSAYRLINCIPMVKNTNIWEEVI